MLNGNMTKENILGEWAIGDQPSLTFMTLDLPLLALAAGIVG